MNVKFLVNAINVALLAALRSYQSHSSQVVSMIFNRYRLCQMLPTLTIIIPFFAGHHVDNAQFCHSDSFSDHISKLPYLIIFQVFSILKILIVEFALNREWTKAFTFPTTYGRSLGIRVTLIIHSSISLSLPIFNVPS